MTTAGIGAFDRGGTPADTQGGNSGWRAVMGGMVANGANSPQGMMTWSELQSTQASNTAGTLTGTGSTTGSGVTELVGTADGKTALDYYYRVTAAYNATSPAIPWKVKIRLGCGIYDPGWMKTLLGTQANNGQTLCQWWTTTYRNYLKAFLTAIAGYVPAGQTYAIGANPLTAEISLGGCMTTYAEPMLWTGPNKSSPWNLTNLGLANDTNPQNAMYNQLSDASAIFPTTPLSISSNPCDYGGVSWTKSFEDYQVNPSGSQVLGTLCVLENNSLRANGTNDVSGIGVTVPGSPAHDPNTHAAWYNTGTYSDGHGSSYSQMYTHLASYGQGVAATALGSGPAAIPVRFTIQTATLKGLGNTHDDLCNTLSYTVWLGAQRVEMPSGYATVIVPSELGNYNAGWQANFPAGTPVSPPGSGGQFPAATTGPGISIAQ